MQNQICHPEPSPLCAAFIPTTAYPANESCMLQSQNNAAVTQLANANVNVNQMDLMSRLNKHVVVPLPAIQTVAGIQLPASQCGPVLPDSGLASAGTIVGLFYSLLSAEY